jgi:hypothetical protein
MQIESATLHFQFGQLNMSDEDIEDIDQKLGRLRDWTGESAYVLALMLGVTNHWTSLAIVKRGPNVAFYYFDSKNRNVLNRTTTGLRQLLAEYEQEHLASGRELPKWQREVFEQYVKDMQLTYDLLNACVRGDLTLAAFNLQRTLELFCGEIRALNPADHPAVSKWASEYQHNVVSFFVRRWAFFQKQLCHASRHTIAQLRLFLAEAAKHVPKHERAFWKVYSAVIN